MKKKNLGHYTLEITAVILLFLVWVGLANATFELDKFGLGDFGRQIANMYNLTNNTTPPDNSIDNTTDEDPIIVTDPNTIDPAEDDLGEQVYDCNRCGYVDGKGVCNSGTASHPCDNTCVTNSDCPDKDGGGDGGGGETPIDGGGGTVPDDQYPTHYVCENSLSCVIVDGAGENECIRNSDCGGESPPGGGGDEIPPSERESHSECSGNVCAIVFGPGSTGGQDSCYSNADCSSSADNALTPTQSWFKAITDTFSPLPGLEEQESGNDNDGKHYECRINEFGNYCIALPGEGPDNCTAGDFCKSPADGWHTECLGDNIGTDAWCRFVEGEGADECDQSSSCKALTNNKHTECINDVCEWVSGQGLNQCSQTDGTKCKPGGDPHGSNFDNILNTIKEFFDGLWTGFMSLLSL